MPKIRDPNEGCMHCHEREEYNGARNLEIRYLCGICTQGLAAAQIDNFLAIEASLKALKPIRKRFRGIAPSRGTTLSTYKRRK